MEHIGTERNISLYSMPYMVNKYKTKSNFLIVSEKELSLFYGRYEENKNFIDYIGEISLSPMNENNFEKVVKYDKDICDGLEREYMFRELIKSEGNVNLVAINKMNEVVGYCFICLTVQHMGKVEPLYADNEQIAELLFNKCCQLSSVAKTKRLAYICWNNNLNSLAIVNKLSELELLGNRPLLFTKKYIEGKADKIYCVSTRAFYPF